jgi:glycogen synthase
VVPSIYEPFGLVALEAMASGCLCLVADTGGLREVVPEDGTAALRFQARDPKSLARMLEKMLTDEELRERLIAEAREHILDFDWTEVAAETAIVYDDLVATAAATRV